MAWKPDRQGFHVRDEFAFGPVCRWQSDENLPLPEAHHIIEPQMALGFGGAQIAGR